MQYQGTIGKNVMEYLIRREMFSIYQEKNTKQYTYDFLKNLFYKHHTIYVQKIYGCLPFSFLFFLSFIYEYIWFCNKILKCVKAKRKTENEK